VTRAPRLSARMRALAEAAEIADLFAEEYCAKRDDACRAENGEAALTFARQAQACTEIARLIRERMQNRRAR
jgi:hypothetical protein